MDNHEQQNEEREVLGSIYDGDEAFKQISDTVFQYKYGEHEDVKSFLLEISWSQDYPSEKPTITMDTFYNRNILQSVKNKILDAVNKEAEQWIGCAMTYTLFESLKDKYFELMEEQTAPVIEIIATDFSKLSTDPEKYEDESKKNPKKEQLTKAQKRRVWDRAESGKGGEKPRGWDWVDIVKHLSQVPHTKSPIVTS